MKPVIQQRQYNCPITRTVVVVAWQTFRLQAIGVEDTIQRTYQCSSEASCPHAWDPACPVRKRNT